MVFLLSVHHIQAMCEMSVVEISLMLFVSDFYELCITTQHSQKTTIKPPTNNWGMFVSATDISLPLTILVYWYVALYRWVTDLGRFE